MILACITALASMKSPPKTNLAMSMESCARSGDVTPPMNGFVDSVRCASIMSRCRLFTGTSVGSTTVPPEW